MGLEFSEVFSLTYTCVYTQIHNLKKYSMDKWENDLFLMHVSENYKD